MSFTGSSTNWIWANMDGSALASDSSSAGIQRHEAHGRFNFDLTQGTGGGDDDSTANPFLATTATSGPGSSNGGGSGASEDESSGVADRLTNMQIAHGVMMGLAFLWVDPRSNSLPVPGASQEG